MTAELKAGFFVLMSVAALVFMTTRLTQNQFSFAGTKVYYANINDATGLLSKTKVKMAGLDVGQLTKLELAGKHARITVEIASDLTLHTDASIAVKAIGFLGDKYLELTPGTDSKPVIAEGGYIPEGVAAGSLDQLTAKTTQLVDNLKDITDLLKEALKGTGEGQDGSRLDRILDNMEQFSEGLAGVDKLGDLADRMTEVAANVRDITSKVSRGEGTIGKLLTDSETIDRINQALSGVNKLVTKVDKLQVMVDARSALLTNVGGSRSAFSLILQPTYDKYYLFGITTRPQGVTSITTTKTTNEPQNAGAATSTQQVKTTNDTGVGFNAQFAKRFGDFTFRLGLFETTGGVAADYSLFEDRARLSIEAYRFGSGGTAQVNIDAEVSIYRPFFVWGGGDYISSKDNRSFFVGGGIRFTDQDIKALITTAVGAAAK
ncbi:MAG: MCE family protein [Deltaproteobacteria bacterium]|nr:MCE family protein [Deltaproteobacteria bacterium]